MRVAAAGRGLIYTSASFSGQSDFVSQEFCICVNTVVTKSACPTAAEKRLSASICLCRRCRSQPLSSVSGRKRYNTLDFASKIVCQQGCFSPLLETQSQGDVPLWTPHFSSHCGGQTTKMQFATDAKKNKRKHLRQDREGANLPFGADNLKLDMVQFQIVSFCLGREIRKQPWRIPI